MDRQRRLHCVCSLPLCGAHSPVGTKAITQQVLLAHSGTRVAPQRAERTLCHPLTAVASQMYLHHYSADTSETMSNIEVLDAPTDPTATPPLHPLVLRAWQGCPRHVRAVWHQSRHALPVARPGRRRAREAVAPPVAEAASHTAAQLDDGRPRSAQ